EADRLDPGWTLEQLEAKRPALQAGSNAAVAVVNAVQGLPTPWPDDRLHRLTTDIPSQAQLNDQQVSALRSELQSRMAALKEARRLGDLPTGRYQVTWAQDITETMMPHLQSL